MNFSNLMPLLHTAELSLAEKGISSAKVILTGFVVVFSVLILLILIINLYSFIVSKALNNDKKKKKQKIVETKNTSPVPKPVTSKIPAQKVDDGVSEEVVAVISAAVASMYGYSEKAKIKSIKKSSGGRSAWANAGVLENTRPF